MSEFPSGTTPELSIKQVMHEATLASIARFAVANTLPSIPSLDPSELEAGNDRARAEYGDDARRLLILGPDVVMFDMQPPVVINPKRRHIGLSLGSLITERRITRQSVYLDYDTNPDETNLAARKQVHRHSRIWLTEHILDRRGEPLVTHRGTQGGGRYGTPDILVKDFRHTKQYQQMWFQRSLDVCRDYIANDGPAPGIIEPGAIQAAWQVLNEEVDVLHSPATEQRIDTLRELTPRLETPQITAPPALSPDIEKRIRKKFAEELEPSWQDDAQCRITDKLATSFYTHPGEKTRDRSRREEAAKAVCVHCPVKKPCLEAALNRKETHGIWAGIDFTSTGNRKKIAEILSA